MKNDQGFADSRAAQVTEKFNVKVHYVFFRLNYGMLKVISTTVLIFCTAEQSGTGAGNLDLSVKKGTFYI